MTQYAFICLLVGSISWGQAVTTGPVMSDQGSTNSATVAGTTTPNAGRDSGASGAQQNKPLITIEGLCEHPTATAATSTCTTVITRAEFERVVNALHPGMTKRAQREFAKTYSDALIMASKAEQMGLDKGPIYEEEMQLARTQVLSQALKKAILEKASKILEADIEQYYRNNVGRFEKAEVERIYVPKNEASLSVSAANITPSGGQVQADGEMAKMKIEADDLRARAVAGEDFLILEADAYKRAGIKSATPATTMWIRRISLPPDQASVMDLDSGTVSPVLADTSGYFIYRMKSKGTLPLEQVRGEIIETLRSQRIQTAMQDVLGAAGTTVDASYFK